MNKSISGVLSGRSTPWWFWLIVVAWVGYSARIQGQAEEKVKQAQAQVTKLQVQQNTLLKQVNQALARNDSLHYVVDSVQSRVVIVDRTVKPQIDTTTKLLAARLDSIGKIMLDSITSGYSQQITVRDSTIAALTRLTQIQDTVIQSQKALITLTWSIQKVTYDAWQNEHKLNHPNAVRRMIDALSVAAVLLLIT